MAAKKPNNVPVVIAEALVEKPDDLVPLLKSRGFEVLTVQLNEEDSNKSNDKKKTPGNANQENKKTNNASESASKAYSFMVRPTMRLLTKTAVRCGFTSCDLDQFSKSEILEIVVSTFDVIRRIPGIEVKEIWLAHTSSVQPHTGQKDYLSEIRGYYGSQIAIYFHWLSFYCEYLKLPAYLGLALTVYQFFSGHVETLFFPICGLLTPIWSMIFLEMWKRQHSFLQFSWGSNLLMGWNEEKSRPPGQGNGDESLAEAVGEAYSRVAETRAAKPPGMLSKSLRITISVLACAVIISGLFGVMLTFCHYKNALQSLEGSSLYASLCKHAPTVGYSVFPIVAESAFGKIAKLLNDFEGHSSPFEQEMYLTYKTFALVFVNRYCALLYATFWLRDLSLIRSLLISLLITGAIVNNIMEVGVPFLVGLFKREKSVSGAFNAMLRGDVGSKSPKDVPNTSRQSTANDAAAKTEAEACDAMFSTLHFQPESELDEQLWSSYLHSVLEKEKSLPKYTISEDYLELVVQFGYITMFCAAFPLAPFLGYFNNLHETRVDLLKLTCCRRPALLNRSSIVIWQNCLHVICYVSILTNCFLACLVSNQLIFLLPEGYRFIMEHSESRWFLMIFFEHLLVFTKFFLSAFVSDTSALHRDLQAAQLVRRVEKAEADHLRRARALARSGSARNVLSQDQASEIDNKLSIRWDNAERNIASAKISADGYSQFGFNPSTAISILFGPVILHYVGIPPWVYIPLAAFYLLYMQAAKDRHDRKLAMGIISDPATLKLVIGEAPDWVKDSEFQQVEWLNGVVNKLWSRVSEASSKIILTAVNPILESYRPSFFTSFSLTHVSLGSVTPKLTGVKFHSSTSEPVVRLDIQLLWAGDPEIVLEAGCKPIPLVVELTQIRFSASLRVELSNLISEFPCFGAIAVTCMEKPFIDFSLRLANFDVMNIPSSVTSSTRLISAIIQSVVCDLLLYPKKLVIPLNKDIDLSALNAPPPPVGVVVVTVVRCNDLMVGDLTSSDPYVTVKLSEQSHHTSTRMHTLNPVFDETFDFIVQDKDTQYIELSVFDWDQITAHDLLGTAIIQMSTIDDFLDTIKTINLNDADRGSITVNLRYIPLLSKQEEVRTNATSKDDDILFPSALSNSEEGQRLSFAPDEANSLSTPTGRPWSLRSTKSTPSSTFSPISDLMSSGLNTVTSITSGIVGTGTSSTSKQSRPKDLTYGGVLRIFDIKCANLRSSFSLFKRSPKSYVEFVVNSSISKKTKKVRGVMPSFEETFFIVLDSPAGGKIEGNVWETRGSNSPRLFGVCSLAIDDVVASKKIHDQYKLHSGSSEECILEYSVEWYPMKLQNNH